MSFFGLSFISLLTLAVAYKDPHFCDGRSVIVQLFGWRFLDIAKECKNFLGPKGYGGVQVSPITASIVLKNRPWQEMYQPISYKINSRFGNQKEFEYMVKTCNQARVRIYIDVVLNHMAPNKCLCYPDVPYTYEHFHLPECTIKNCSNNVTEIRNCKLFGRPDLNQSNKYVIKVQLKFLNFCIKIGVAGFRISDAKHMWPMDLKIIYEKLDNLSCKHGFPPGARPFIYHHVVNDKAVSKWEYNKMGCVEEREFSTILSILFKYNSLKSTAKMERLEETYTPRLLPSHDAIVRIDDHYTQRGLYTDSTDILTYKDKKLYKIAVLYALSYPYGIFCIMSSYKFDDNDQGPPANSNGSIRSPHSDNNDKCVNGFVCEHRDLKISIMVKIRNSFEKIKDEKIRNFWCNEKDQIAFTRGKCFFTYNWGKGDLRQKLYTGLPDGTYCDVLTGDLNNGKCRGGSMRVENGSALVKLSGADRIGVNVFCVGELG